MFSYFINLLCRLLRAAVVLFIILPLIWIVCTPMILIASLFVPGSYLDTVSRGYWYISRIWVVWGDIRFSR